MATKQKAKLPGCRQVRWQAKKIASGFCSQCGKQGLNVSTYYCDSCHRKRMYVLKLRTAKSKVAWLKRFKDDWPEHWPEIRKLLLTAATGNGKGAE